MAETLSAAHAEAAPRSGGSSGGHTSSSSSSIRLDAYPAIETLERQYAAPVGQRILLLIHLNGNACYAGGVEALLNQGGANSPLYNNATAPMEEPSTTATNSNSTTTSDASSSTLGAADPFSFLSQDGSAATQTTTTATAAAPRPQQGKSGGKGGFRNFFSKVAKTTTQHLERGITHLAIRADRGKSPDYLAVALQDADTGYLLGVTESVMVPADDVRTTAGLRFRIPLYLPANVVTTSMNVQCHVYLKPGGLWHTSKPFLVASSQRLAVPHLREAAAKHAVWTLPLSSSVVVDGKMTVTVLPDTKFPPLCGPGWSLADPNIQGYQAQWFDYPLDQSYALPCTLPAPLGFDAPPAGTTTAPPPPATSTLLITERTTESAVVLPTAAAWWNALVAPAVQVSFQHAQAVAARVAHHRPDTREGAAECHVTMHAMWLTHVPQPVMRRVSVHQQRPDAIWEVEWGTGMVVALDAQSHTNQALPPPATVLTYPKPVTEVLPSLQNQPCPPHGYRLGVVRFQIENAEGQHHHQQQGPLWEAFCDLDRILVHQQSGQPLKIPIVPVDQPGDVVGHLSLTIRLTPPTATSAPPLPLLVNPAAGLVALVGLPTVEPVIQPALDALSPTDPVGGDEQAKRRAAQLATMGFFYTAGYMDYHMQQIRPADSNAMAERAKAYQTALARTSIEERPPAHQDRAPRAFRPSSSRSEVLLSGIPFNCHTATLQLSLVTPEARQDKAYFYNITCGAPADHARGFGNIFHKETERLGLVCPVGTVSGGLRRLEAKRAELVKVVNELQTMIIMQVANYFVTERQKQKTTHHVPTRDQELLQLRWKLFEAVQSLHHVTWQCAVRRANVFSQALGLALTCFLASISDAAKWKSTWPDLWSQQGFLVCFEGLLSAAGKELGMIEDASVGIDMLKNVQIALVADDGASPSTKGRFPIPFSPYLKWIHISTTHQTTDLLTEYVVQIGIVPSYYEQRIPGNIKDGAKVRLYPLLFEVGVDIRQWGAHAASNAKNNMRRSESGEYGPDKEGTGAVEPTAAAPQGLLDDEDDDVGVTDDDVLVQLNYEAFQKLNAYAHRISPANSLNSSQKIHPLLETLHQHILSSSGKINHDILDEAATLSQQLGGGAVVFCKSGKDRTAMHVTYKQAQFANRYKQTYSPEATSATILETSLEDATAIRTHGTRLPICEKNVGQAKYAFNSLQVKFMPEKLKPPMNTLAGFLKGGKVFTGGIES
eukprot:scaffold6899_cov183-Amphora_coffeaeformis.AAC.21